MCRVLTYFAWRCSTNFGSHLSQKIWELVTWEWKMCRTIVHVTHYDSMKCIGLHFSETLKYCDVRKERFCQSILWHCQWLVIANDISQWCVFYVLWCKRYVWEQLNTCMVWICLQCCHRLLILGIIMSVEATYCRRFLFGACRISLCFMLLYYQFMVYMSWDFALVFCYCIHSSGEKEKDLSIGIRIWPKTLPCLCRCIQTCLQRPLKDQKIVVSRIGLTVLTEIQEAKVLWEQQCGFVMVMGHRLPIVMCFGKESAPL